MTTAEEGDGENPHVDHHRRLHERDVEAARGARILRVVAQVDEDEDGEEELRGQLLPAPDALRVLLRHLLVVVGEADEAEEKHRAEHQPVEMVFGIAPEERADGHGEKDEDAAHGRRSLLAAVEIGQLAHLRLLPQGLPELQAGEQHDDPRPEEEGEDERGQRAAMARKVS